MKEESKKTAFQLLLQDAETLFKMYIEKYTDYIPFINLKEEMYEETLADTIMLYLSSWLQSASHRKKSIYQYVNDGKSELDPVETRRYYRFENKIRQRTGQGVKGERRSYDEADFIGMERLINGNDPLTEHVNRKNIHRAKNFSNGQFAEAFKKYYEEIEAAQVESDDEKYVATSIHFYRKENAMSFSLIACIVEYMKKLGYSRFDFELVRFYWTAIPVRDLNKLKSKKLFIAGPNVLTYYQYIPMAFAEYYTMLSSYCTGAQVLIANEVQVGKEYAARMLKRNVFEMLSISGSENSYKNFDFREIADFIRERFPIIESHRPISFYEDVECTRPDGKKIQLARNIMKDYYSFAKNDKKK